MTVRVLGEAEAGTLDPGIREIVQRLRAAGFETTDSGDGRSKPQAWFDSGEALPFAHVVAETTVSMMIADAERMARLLGTGWDVQASYSTTDRHAVLFASSTDAV